MPRIYLKETNKYEIRSSRYPNPVTVNITSESYQFCNLFKRYKHELIVDKTRDINVYNKMSDLRGLTIRLDGQYRNKQLEHAEVYFNKYDKTHTNPLLLSLHFDNGSENLKDKYYQYSEIERLMERRPKSISEVHDFDNDEKLFEYLILDNYESNNSLTFQIDNDNTSGGTYNSRTINISKTDIKIGQSNGFHKYTHTPKHGAKNSYILYNMNVLVKKDKAPIDEIQDKEYSSIEVYFGNKAKENDASGGLSNQKDVPLLIELNKKEPPNEPEYYVHKRKNNQYYWVNLKDTIGELLTDIGLSTSSTGRGYDQLAPILRKATLSPGTENDLNDKLKQATGSKLQRLLSQQVGDTGSSNPTLLVLLLRQIEFNLVDSVIILLEKTVPPNNTYDETAVNQVVGNLDPRRDINRVKMENGGKIITLNDQTADKGACVQTYKYKIVEHNFNSLVSGLDNRSQPFVGIRFIIPNSDDKFKQLMLYNGDKTEPQNLEYKYYHNSRRNGVSPTNSDKVYVWFYNGGDKTGKGDPRPLLLCYGGTAYAPKDKEKYFTEWVKVNELATGANGGLKDCGCPQGPDAHVPADQNTLLKELDRVVKFLNKVDIKEGTTSIGSRKDPHTYEVQKFKGQKIQIQVTCSPVVGSEPPPLPGTCTTSTTSCYKKFEHRHSGMTNGAENGSGYRLGEVVYNGSNGNPKGTLNYKSQGSEHPYYPLVGVTVFYYDKDSNYDDPLLIELEFKTNGVGGGVGAGPKEYYKLTTGGGTIGGLQWKKDDNAERAIGSDGDPNNEKLVNYLDSIRYDLKKTIKIYIEKQMPYELYLSEQAGATSGGYSKENSKQIQVSEYKNGCEKLVDQGYKCYVHQISTINGQFNYNKVGGLKFYISGKVEGGDNDIEIKLYKDNDGEGDTGNGQIKEITYNTCMADVYVYFYCKNGSEQVDNVPLMLRYNSVFYEPESRDNYFTKWDEEPSLHTILKSTCGDDGRHTHLATKLDTINKDLNKIELDCGKINKHGYGLPEKSELKGTFNIERVKVTIQNGPTKQPNIYLRVTHRTVNGFRFGDICYNNEEIVENGVKINGPGVEGTIKIDKNGNGKNNHWEFVKTNNPNTVVTYYSTSDSDFKLPQLILIMNTEQPIPQDQQPITSSSNKYGYYILATCKGGVGYQFEWRTPSDEQVTLNDETELLLLNSVVILLEQKPVTEVSARKNGEYSDDKICAAVRKAIELGPLKPSPGLTNDINRLKNKNITLTDETNKATRLKDTGFRVISHDLNKFVKLEIPGATEVTLIASLRYMIPTREKDTYRLITLYEDNKPITLFHQKSQDSVYVYFYDPTKDGKGDPRPLLLCYNNKAYKARSIPNYNRQMWYKDPNIDNPLCDETKRKSILSALVKVSNFLNFVQIENVNESQYTVHRFNGQHIIIKVQPQVFQDKFCYNKYTHTHNGTGSGGTGFRMGYIMYGYYCIYDKTNNPHYISSLTSEKPDYCPASEVVVYYYKRDPNYNNPLLVALKDNSTYKPYYELLRDSTDKRKIYTKKNHQPINLDHSKGSDLEKLLDKILYYISKSILINLSFRVKTEVKYHGERGKPIPTIKHNTYQAKVYENESEYKLTKTNQPLKVQVSDPTDIKDATGKQTGYQCYSHKLTNAQSVEQIGGLRLFLWDNRKPEEEDKEDCKVTQPTQDTKKQCCEIKLYEKSKPPNGQQDQEINPIAYTTCKGDLYVYFYGSDPRPLLLCYNGDAYKPENMDEYDKKWCYVTGIESCQCSEKGFTASKNLLEQLYQISMFLNPVRLSETIDAYKVVKKFIEGRKKDKEQGKYTGKLGDKLPEHDYTMQTFGDIEIKMKVKSTDLLCYRQSIGHKCLLRYKNMCKLILIMYYICIYVKIYTGENNGK